VYTQYTPPNNNTDANAGDKISFNLLKLNSSSYNFYLGFFLPSSWSDRTVTIKSSQDPQNGALTAPGKEDFGAHSVAVTKTAILYSFSGTTTSGQARIGLQIGRGQPLVSFLMVEETSAAIPAPVAYTATLIKPAEGIASYSAPFAAATTTSISPGVDGASTKGGNLAFTITPANGYTLTGVSATNGTAAFVDNTIIVRNITANTTISLTMVKAVSTVTLTKPQTSVAAYSAPFESSDTTTVSAGGQVTFSITPAAGYVLTGAAATGGAEASFSGNTITVSNINADATITLTMGFTAAFASNNTEFGAITSGASQNIAAGGAAAFTAAPSEGYKIGSISPVAGTIDPAINGQMGSTSFTISGLTAPQDFIVNFVPQTFTVGYSIIGAGAGGAASLTASTVGYNGQTTLNITPEPGYTIVEAVLANSDGAQLTAVSGTQYAISEVKADAVVNIRFSNRFNATRAGSAITPEYVNNGTTAVSGKFIVAVFDTADKKLAALKEVSFSAAAGAIATSTEFNNFVNGFPTPTYFYEAYCWGDDSTPIASNVEITS
jgi:hypothetical protein